jgi:SDR family mycofactocin-dependent oxidoreductase
MSNERVAGKVVLVTGAARGQGRSHAVRLAEEGADLIAVDLFDAIPNTFYPSATAADMAETVAAVEAAGRRIMAFEADVRDAAALRSAVDAGVAEFGRLDVVVANAGIVYPAAWDDISEEVWNQVISTNLTGTWNTIRISAPHLISAGAGSIICISSAAGLKGLPFLSAYVASKHGVVGLMRAFATELAEHNIRVNSLHPTGVDTPMNSVENVDRVNRLIEAHPRLGPMFTNLLPVDMTESIDLSHAVLFLASDESRYVTSSTMTVDAGNTQF